MSVVVPIFDSQGHLAHAPLSLTDQTCRDFEAAVSDGASLDNRGFELVRGQWELGRLNLRYPV